MDPSGGEGNLFVTQNKAREIMEDNFLDPEMVYSEIKKRHNGFLSKPPSDEFQTVPIAERELGRYRAHYILIPGYELCLEDFYSLATYDLGFELEDAWSLGLAFSKEERVNRCWYLVRKSIVPGSRGQTYYQMQERLWPGEEIPRACELIYTMFFYCIFSEGAHLYRGNYPLCKDIVFEDFRPHVGFFQGKLGIRYYNNNLPHPKIGLVPIRKLIVP